MLIFTRKYIKKLKIFDFLISCSSTRGETTLNPSNAFAEYIGPTYRKSDYVIQY